MPDLLLTARSALLQESSDCAGIQTPSAEDKWFEPAKLFVKEKIHQREVDFEVLSTDKRGGLIGNLWFGKEVFSHDIEITSQSLATLLVNAGYAKIFRDADTELAIAEESAKRAKKGIWENWDEAAERKKAEERRAKREEESNKSNQKPFELIVTEVIDGARFYAQIVSPGTVFPFSHR